MKKSHHKDPTHAAVIGIVAVVAIIGLVLLLVNLAPPEQRVGQVTEIFKQRSQETTYDESESYGNKQPLPNQKANSNIFGNRIKGEIVVPPNVIAGKGGNDNLVGSEQDDTILAGPGDDTVIGKGGDDLISGNQGDDKIIAGDGNDRVDGGKGDDYIDAGAGDDLIGGGPGDDIILAGPGDDVIFPHIDVTDVTDPISLSASPTSQRDIVKCGPGHDIVYLNEDASEWTITSAEENLLDGSVTLHLDWNSDVHADTPRVVTIQLVDCEEVYAYLGSGHDDDVLRIWPIE
jgi:Ca2+-binding RTX toxin-like protein